MHNSTCNAKNPRRIDEILDEIIQEIGGENCIADAIRKEKCCIIEDIYRVKYVSGVIDKRHLEDISPENWYTTFCHYYEQSIEWLNVHLASLSAELTIYMRGKVHQRCSQGDPNLLYNAHTRQWLRRDNRGNWNETNEFD